MGQARLRRGRELPIRDAYRYEQTITHDLSTTADTKEAQTAFVEKRKADFSNKG